MRTVLVFLGGYIGLFLLHIVAAAQDLNLLFMAVASMLVGLTFLCGPVLLIIEKRTTKTETTSVASVRSLLETGYLLSLPLSVGIAYASTDRVLQLNAAVVALLLTTSSHAVARGVLSMKAATQSSEPLASSTPE